MIVAVTADAPILVDVPERQKTVAEIAVGNILASRGIAEPGLIEQARAAKRAADAVSAALALAISAYRNDGDYSQGTYASYWKVTRRVAQRDWEAFREAFPGLDSPEPLARAIVAEYGRRLEKLNPSAGLSVPAALLPA